MPRLGPLTLPNPVLKAATFEGMTPGGRISDALIAFHTDVARGGAAMTTIAYGAVQASGRTFGDQLLLDDDNMPPLRRLVDAVHAEGAAVSVQLAHCGGFSRLAGPKGPSAGLNLYGLALGVPWVRAMTLADFDDTLAAFAAAAKRVAEAGVDAVEVHLGHGYFLHQLLSARTNRREDVWGGDAERRRAFPRRVLEVVREAIGPHRAMLAKVNLDDFVKGGITVEDAIVNTQMALDAGCDAVVLSCGLVDRTPFSLLRGDVPIPAMARYEPVLTQKVALRAFAPFVVRRFDWEPLFLLPLAKQVRAAVDGTLVLLGGVHEAQHLATAAEEGFAFVQVGRAILHDPSIVRRWLADPQASSGCIHCNLCVAEMEHEGVRCTER